MTGRIYGVSIVRNLGNVDRVITARTADNITWEGGGGGGGYNSKWYICTDQHIMRTPTHLPTPANFFKQHMVDLWVLEQLLAPISVTLGQGHYATEVGPNLPCYHDKVRTANPVATKLDEHSICHIAAMMLKGASLDTLCSSYILSFVVFLAC